MSSSYIQYYYLLHTFTYFAAHRVSKHILHVVVKNHSWIHCLMFKCLSVVQLYWPKCGGGEFWRCPGQPTIAYFDIKCIFIFISLFLYNITMLHTSNRFFKYTNKMYNKLWTNYRLLHEHVQYSPLPYFVE